MCFSMRLLYIAKRLNVLISASNFMDRAINHYFHCGYAVELLVFLFSIFTRGFAMSYRPLPKHSPFSLAQKFDMLLSIFLIFGVFA